MLFERHLVVVRGGGDLASGVVAQLHKAGFPVVVLELEQPLAIRRTVAFAAAVEAGEVTVDGIEGRLAADPASARRMAEGGTVAVLVSPKLPDLSPEVVVDGRMAKRNIDTSREDAPLTVGLGPGFVAGIDCDAVVETKRGHRLGRVIWDGSAAPDTGVPGSLGGVTADRVVRSPGEGAVAWDHEIEDVVAAGQRLGVVGAIEVEAPIGGVVRGLIAPGFVASDGLKIGDIDPRADPDACREVSDKARLVGSGVLEAVLMHLGGTRP